MSAPHGDTERLRAALEAIGAAAPEGATLRELIVRAARALTDHAPLIRAAEQDAHTRRTARALMSGDTTAPWRVGATVVVRQHSTGRETTGTVSRHDLDDETRRVGVGIRSGHFVGPRRFPAYASSGGDTWVFLEEERAAALAHIVAHTARDVNEETLAQFDAPADRSALPRRAAQDEVSDDNQDRAPGRSRPSRR